MSAFTDHRQTVFEVELHNQAVRECVKENRSHEIFDDRWADVQTHEVAASDEHKALAMIENTYPSSDGFVVDHVKRLG
ncbi:hypothetical protein ACTU44_15575 [Thalassospira sp. SM2505]|uniref:Uncharacterized protein n=1 Tax=Thalassospira profundimaris TaxID=502049 RepID=A0A367WXY7_9PROT|nr:hypothetical protein [Thalassospira profundimaris]RCK45371.1 hypothetical protein TH30_12365 [Thalassospira profundimaris]